MQGIYSHNTHTWYRLYTHNPHRRLYTYNTQHRVYTLKAHNSGYTQNTQLRVHTHNTYIQSTQQRYIHRKLCVHTKHTSQGKHAKNTHTIGYIYTAQDTNTHNTGYTHTIHT